jgi:hypothetical protein
MLNNLMFPSGRPRRWRRILGLLITLVSWPCWVAAETRSDAPFTIVAMGDAPYTDPIDFLRFSGLIHTINALAPVFSVHIGDFKSGSRRCTDRRLTRIRDYFNDLDSALIYTPGDNEWTDCHRLTAGGYDPLERLALLRRHYFSTPMSLGRAPISLSRQSETPRFRKYVENARWERGGIGFLTAHVVGSYNNSERREVAARKEFAERDVASASWISDGFKWAGETGKRGLMVFIHADPLRGRDHNRKLGRPFKRTVTTLTKGAAAFGKPVLLVHGDFHEYKLDKPFTDPDGNTIENLTRLEVPGAPNVWGVRIDIDPASKDVFKIAPLAIPSATSEPPD